MARGRMLNRSVSLSVAFARLPDDTCRLLATWIIPQLDCRGVFYADPAIVRSLVFPMRTDITVDRVEGYMRAIAAAGLVTIFSARGQRWQHWTGFEHNQIGLRADRETTDFPPPPDNSSAAPDIPGTNPEGIRKESGIDPAKIREKSAEGEGEVKAQCEVKGGSAREIRDPLFDAVARVTDTDPLLMGQDILRTTERLRAIGATPAQVDRSLVWFKAEHWLGQKDEPLTFKLLLSTWKDAQAGKSYSKRRTRRMPQVPDATPEERERARGIAARRVQANDGAHAVRMLDAAIEKMKSPHGDDHKLYLEESIKKITREIEAEASRLGMPVEEYKAQRRKSTNRKDEQRWGSPQPEVKS